MEAEPLANGNPMNDTSPVTTSLPPSTTCRCGLPKFPHEVACWVCKDVVRCANCGGVAQGRFNDGDETCGAVTPATSELPKTECEGFRRLTAAVAEAQKPFKARVATLLRKIEQGSEGMCPDCFASIDAGIQHRKGCTLAALLKECEA